MKKDENVDEEIERIVESKLKSKCKNWGRKGKKKHLMNHVQQRYSFKKKTFKKGQQERKLADIEESVEETRQKQQKRRRKIMCISACKEKVKRERTEKRSR